MAILQIADKPTLDEVNLKVDNLNKKLDYEAQTIRTLVGYELIASDDQVLYSLNNPELSADYEEIIDISGSITIEYAGTIKVGAYILEECAVANPSMLRVYKNGVDVGYVIGVKSSTDYVFDLTDVISVNVGDVLTFKFRGTYGTGGRRLLKAKF